MRSRAQRKKETKTELRCIEKRKNNNNKIKKEKNPKQDAERKIYLAIKSKNNNT